MFVNEPTVLSFLFFILAAWAYYQDVYVRKQELRRSRVPSLLIAAVVTYPLLTLALPFIDSIRANWDNDKVKLLPFVLVSLVGTGIAIVIYYREIRNKREELQQVAYRLGLSYDPEGKIPLPAGLLQVPILEPLREVTHVLRSASQNNECAMFQYRMSLGEDDVSHTIAAHRVSCPIPAFLLKPETFYDKLSTALGEPDVDFPTHQIFSSRYRLVCSEKDESTVRQMFTNGLLPLFEREQGWTIGCRRDWVAIYKHRALVGSQDLPNFYKKTKSIAEAIASATRSVVP